MIILGVDAHKRAHTIVAVDPNGRQLAPKTITTTTKEHLGLLNWAEQLAKGNSLLWAIEDFRHLPRRLERDPLAAGQSIVRVPPKLMPQSVTRPAPTASPIPSIRWPSHGPLSGNPTFTRPDWMALTTTCGYSAIT
ncbi:transposase [Rhodococcus sp. KBS0724]|uniref:IS110 family transposase n=1 Tax=Rhodococcus sp. KBS0724 TaxID=1179674 RepID=UPI00163DB626|nr:transposase [Rhodococcus sp. KBS0724]